MRSRSPEPDRDERTMANGEMRASGRVWSGGAAREVERKRTEEEGGRGGDEEEPWRLQARPT